MPTIDDVRKAREQAVAAVTGAFEQARNPFLAALGAGDVAAQTLLDTVTKARTQLAERADAARSGLPTDAADVRGRLEPAELRKLVEQYREAAQHLYQYLTEHGEQTLDRLRSQPQVKRAVEQFDQAAAAAQQRAESAVGDARELADEVLGRVARRTRSTGATAARRTERTADQVADQAQRAGETAGERVKEAGGEAAHEARGTSRRTANRAGQARTSTKSTNGTTTRARSNRAK